MAFRQLRRKKQQLSDEETMKIIQQGKTCVLGLIGDSGYPYTVPMNYIYEKGKIYLHGSNQGHKIDAIRKFNKVSLCVVEKDDVIDGATYFRSVIAFGTAKILDTDDDILHAIKILGMRFNGNKEEVDQIIKKVWNSLCCVEITIEHMTGKEAIELVRAKEQR